jgi:murein DD-endopeptidase MepM/ murein hydrolase activator NlpD
MPVADGIPDLDSLTALGNQEGFGVEQTEPSDPTPPPPDGGDKPTVLLSEAQYGLQNESVTIVQQALIAEGFSIPAGATGYFGDQTKAAYSQFQISLGYSGTDADGAPGCTSLTELGSRQNFLVDCTATGGGGGTSGGRADAPIAAGYNYYISLAFGAPGDYAAGYHTGRDYAADSGTPLVAVLDGTIGQKGWDPDGYGNYVVLQAVNGRDYWYCHMNSASPLATGTAVTANQVIGHVGMTGNATGPHCHFEDRPRGGGYGDVRDPSW